MQQPPIRNASLVAASVYSHSGEFCATARELRLPGRAIDLELVRTYRSSLAATPGVLGRGWSSNLARRVERDADGLLYHDGTGSRHRFTRGRGGAYGPPPGLYGVLREKGEVVLDGRLGARLRFESPDDGGRLLGVADANGNEVRFTYEADAIRIVDTLLHELVISVDGGMWRTVTDHTGRAWSFSYDAEGLLVEVRRPATRDFKKGTSLRYGYDAEHRLSSLTDAKGQTYLVNTYDDAGRVVHQAHGRGEYVIGYPADRRATCRLKSGGAFELEHDADGHVTRSTLRVRADAFSRGDARARRGAVDLVTESGYNAAGEVVSRVAPSGRETRWAYAEDDADPRNRGNLLELTRLPQPAAKPAPDPITVRFEYAPALQLVTAYVDPLGRRTEFAYDKRGNLVGAAYPPVTIQPAVRPRRRAAAAVRKEEVRLQYDASGQLVRRTEIDGAVTAFAYHPVKGDGSSGLLASVTRDADGAPLVTEYESDDVGNRTAVIDGKGAAARLTFNAMGLVETFASREPFAYRVEHTYDANYDEIEAAQTFDRLEADRRTGKVRSRASAVREQREYDELRFLRDRRLVGGDLTVHESFVRDAADRLVRQVRPLGGVTEWLYDERDLVIEKRSAVGAPEAATERFTHTVDGSPRASTDGAGNTTTHEYDAFERHVGFIDPAGATKRQTLDAAGNVTGVAVSDGKDTLIEAAQRYDEWGRVSRVDHVWRGADGEPVGASGWDGAKGVVSTIVEYADNGQPAKVWREGGDVVEYGYDGCGRVTAIGDGAGRSAAFAYDENGAMTEITRSAGDGRVATVLRRGYDAMGRLALVQLGDGPPERFEYNALGALARYVGRSGLEIAHTHDGLGRPTGHAYVVPAEGAGTRAQAVVREYGWDDDFRLATYVDAAGHRTVYKYDERGRAIGIVYPGGAGARVGYDAAGNVASLVDADGRETTQSFDAAGRLVQTTDGAGATARYRYDAAGRLIGADGPATMRRSYDSLSRVQTETSGDRTVRFGHDAAGNLTELGYPSGLELRRTFDAAHRVTSVGTADGTLIAAFAYRADDRLASIRFDDSLVATLDYDDQRRLTSIEYRTPAGALVDGYHYAYDAAGNARYEIQLAGGAAFGERYVFDAARRPVEVRYGMQDVTDDAAAFERETAYEYTTEGRWRTRVDRDGTQAVIERSAGTFDARNRYQRFGRYAFSYDANGNCVRRSSGRGGYCLYTYDTANRLVKVECHDGRRRLTKTIEYFYDALGRLIRKVVTDAAGVSQETTYVWLGSVLAEEYEDGTLARTYVHGVGAIPVRLSSQKAGAEFIYIVDGRGLVTGITPKADPNEFAERYGYELTGSMYVTELGGVPVAIPERSTTVSGLDNPLVTGDVFGSILNDWANGTFGGSGGGQMDPTIADALNSLGEIGAKGHHGVKSQMADQLSSLIGMLGLGGDAAGAAPSSTPPTSGFGGGPDWSLYADGDGDLTPPPLVSVNDDGSTTVHNADGTSSTGTGPASDRPVKDDPPSLTPSNNGSGGSGGSSSTPATSGLGGNPAPGSNGSPPDKPFNPGDNPLNDKINQAISDHPVAAAAIGLVIQAIQLSTGGVPKGMSDPDAAGGGAVIPPTAGELESRFNRLKHPVNPDGGGPDSGQIDTSSPPPQHTGADPTVILVDPDASTGGTSGTPKINTAPIDYVPGWQPGAPGQVPAGGGGTDGNTTGRYVP